MKPIQIVKEMLKDPSSVNIVESRNQFFIRTSDLDAYMEAAGITSVEGAFNNISRANAGSNITSENTVIVYDKCRSSVKRALIESSDLMVDLDTDDVEDNEEVDDIEDDDDDVLDESYSIRGYLNESKVVNKLSKKEFEALLPKVASDIKASTKDLTFVKSTNLTKEEKSGMDEIFLKVNRGFKGSIVDGAERVIKNVGGVTFIYYDSKKEDIITAPYVYLFKSDKGVVRFKYFNKYLKKAYKNK